LALRKCGHSYHAIAGRLHIGWRKAYNDVQLALSEAQHRDEADGTRAAAARSR
jgi:hypothetical protein